MAKLNANGVELGSLTTSQRNSLSAVAGEVIYNSTTGTVQAIMDLLGMIFQIF